MSTLVAFLLYAFELMGPITELSQNVTALQSGIAAAGRIREMDAIELEPAAVGSPALDRWRRRRRPVLELRRRDGAVTGRTRPRRSRAST